MFSEEGEQGAPAREAEGRRPKDPGITLDWSERLIEIGMNKMWKEEQSRRETYMSPNKFSVSMTPFSFLGQDTMIIAAESTNWWSNLI